MKGMMKGARLALVVVSVVVIMPMLGHVEALSATCQQGLLTLTPCMAYFQGGGVGSPSFLCCGSLSSIISSQPTCFCEVLNQTSVNINSTIALQALSACAISLPTEIQTCIAAFGNGGGGGGGDSPAPTPSKNTPSSAPTPTPSKNTSSNAPTPTPSHVPSSTPVLAPPPTPSHVPASTPVLAPPPTPSHVPASTPVLAPTSTNNSQPPPPPQSGQQTAKAISLFSPLRILVSFIIMLTLFS